MARDIYEYDSGALSLISDRVLAGADEAHAASFAYATDDGSRILFTTAEALLDEDDDASRDLYERSGGQTTLVSDRVQPGADAAQDVGPAGPVYKTCGKKPTKKRGRRG